MFLEPFYQQKDGFFQISPSQASRFAKDIAADFNPIHNEEAKRFCVPGDLLFALTLNQQGLYQKMTFHFQGMVGKQVQLCFDSQPNQIHLNDEDGKSFLTVEHSGDKTHDNATIESFIKDYVAFSGHNFIHILRPLMEQHQVMVNPARPLIIYEKMSFQLDHFSAAAMRPQLVDTQLEISGKRGDVVLYFDLFDQDIKVGSGQKTLILSGLRPFDQAGMEKLITIYNESRANYLMAS